MLTLVGWRLACGAAVPGVRSACRAACASWEAGLLGPEACFTLPRVCGLVIEVYTALGQLPTSARHGSSSLQTLGLT